MHKLNTFTNKFLFAILSYILFSSCASPSVSFDETAASYQFKKGTVKGKSFNHIVYYNKNPSTKMLRVYLGGDGTPILYGKPSNDPTPRNPITLQLMALDPNSTIFLGRPCYHGLANSPECFPKYWTGARYSEPVVKSMASAIRKIYQTGGYKYIELFGYSGGGTLAMLLAERLQKTQRVVTIAANLDVHNWAKHHEIPGLEASLNPILRPILPNHIEQNHYVGEEDYVVPQKFTAQGVRGQNSRLIVVENFNHICCWVDYWPRIFKELN